MTLDGVVESPTSGVGVTSTTSGDLIEPRRRTSDAMLLGRTYEEFAAFWPSQDGNEPMADYMNDTPKHVVSTTLTELDWSNSSLVSGKSPRRLRAEAATGQEHPDLRQPDARAVAAA